MRKRAQYSLTFVALMAICLGVGYAGTASAKTTTFYEDVLPIVQKNCQVCHRPDGANLGLGWHVGPGVLRLIDVAPYASGGEPDRMERVKHLVPMKRGGQPEEVAHAILWLLSDEASYVTGTNLVISGGWGL